MNFGNGSISKSEEAGQTGRFQESEIEKKIKTRYSRWSPGGWHSECSQEFRQVSAWLRGVGGLARLLRGRPPLVYVEVALSLRLTGGVRFGVQVPRNVARTPGTPTV